MMDKETMRKLQKLSAPKHMLKKMMKKEKVFGEEKKLMEEQVLKHKDLPSEMAKQLRKDLDEGLYDKEQLVIDEKMQKEVDAYVEGKIKAAINRGEIKKWDVKNDVQARKFLKRAKM